MNQTTNRMADWDRFRYFLVLAETGSLSAASHVLGVSSPTVRRQIRDLEDWLCTKLFTRTPDGYVLTETGGRLVDLVATMRTTVRTVERCAGDYVSDCAGRVTIATAEGLGTTWLPSKIAELKLAHSDIEIDLHVSSDHLDLMRLEADIALRLGDPGDLDLIGRRIGRVACGLYAARRYFDDKGTPHSLSDLQHHTIIESSGELERLEQVKQFRRFTDKTSIGIRCNSLLAQFAAMRAGAGILAVPTYMTSDVSDVVRLLPDEFNVELDMWLLTHPDLTKTERVRKTMAFLAESIRSDPKFGTN